MALIHLTNPLGIPLYLNPAHIIAMQPEQDADGMASRATENGTLIFTTIGAGDASWQHWTVIESVDAIIAMMAGSAS